MDYEASKIILKNKLDDINSEAAYILQSDIFEKEYLALCNQYKFTPNTKPVRDFILVWRNKLTLVNI